MSKSEHPENRQSLSDKLDELMKSPWDDIPETRIEFEMKGEKHPNGCQRTVFGMWLIDPECPFPHPDKE